MKTLVLVDFDGTLYRKDSLLEFTKFYKGNTAIAIGFILLLPSIIRWKLGFTSNENAKQKFISHFFKGELLDFFLQKGKQFANENIPGNLNRNIWKSISDHLKENSDIFVVTASCGEWISSWTDKHNLKLISTELEIIDNVITGNFKTRNCYGIEKTNRIKERINLEEYDRIIVFGNGKGDLEMLKLSK